MKNKYFIYALSDVVTGGQELLHQLCDSLNNRGLEAYMVYYPNCDSEIPLPYRNYNINVLQSVIDESFNILILPEALIDLGYNYKYVKKAHWWLSIDNFFLLSILYISPMVYFKLWPKLFFKSIAVKLKYFKVIIKSNRTAFLSNNYILDKDILNFVQSKYAYEFLKKFKFNNVYFLSDYLNSSFNNFNNLNRENVILYNPRKGIKFTSSLINKFPMFKWVAIENMSYEQVNELMTKSKLYVDFGNHPGKDRLPREAALSGMCIITGKQGSALFFEDVSIQDKYKFDESNFDYEYFYKLIKLIFDDFENEYSNFKEYRVLIENSKVIFETEVDEFIKIINKI